MTRAAAPQVLDATSEPGVYVARSRSNPGILYRITGVGTPFVVCACPAAQMERTCWHLQRALAIGGFHEAVTALEEQRKEEKDMTVSFKARAWDEEKDGAGEYSIPEVEDGTYLAHVVDVEDREFPGYQGADPQLKYMVKWELAELEKEDGTPVTLTQFVTIPSGLINEGYLHPKARLFAFLKALGFDPMAPNFDVDPMQWIDKPGKVWVKNVASKTRVDAHGQAEVRPQIVDVTPAAVKKAVTATVRRTVPVATDDYVEELT